MLENKNESYRQTAEQLFSEYYTRLCHFGYNIVKDKILAEDIAQDAFVTYLNSAHNLTNEPRVIKSFLYATVRNACFNVLRHKKIIETHEIISAIDDFEEAGVLEAIIRAEVINEIYKAIANLPEGCREVFKLGYIEGLTNPKIAEHLGISVNTVKTHKQRGLRFIRSVIDPELFFLLFLFIKK